MCANDLHLPIADTEARILATVERELFDADLFEEVLDRALARLTDDAALGLALADIETLNRECANLTPGDHHRRRHAVTGREDPHARSPEA